MEKSLTELMADVRTLARERNKPYWGYHTVTEHSMATGDKCEVISYLYLYDYHIPGELVGAEMIPTLRDIIRAYSWPETDVNERLRELLAALVKDRV
jgi:hypothetical protein